MLGCLVGLMSQRVRGEIMVTAEEVDTAVTDGDEVVNSEGA